MESLCCLNEIHPGGYARIASLSCDAPMRRRLLDMGMAENTLVECLGAGPLGDPSAYCVRGTVVALRGCDSRHIAVRPENAPQKAGAPQEEGIPQERKVVALAGNPNVGKSSLFNALTGMHQHTGNWPGKTVAGARGFFRTESHRYALIDLPGTYSLLAHSAEEEAARNGICFGDPDAVVAVCDATCLERNLNLVLQILEVTPRVIVCLNLMDEAGKKQIRIDLKKLSALLGVPVVATSARQKSSLSALTGAIDALWEQKRESPVYAVAYPAGVEEAIRMLTPILAEKTGGMLPARWLALRLLDRDDAILKEAEDYAGVPFLNDAELQKALEAARRRLFRDIASQEALTDGIGRARVLAAEKICRASVSYGKPDFTERDRRLDRFFTGKYTAFPVMFLFLCAIFWITIVGANLPSSLLSDFLFSLQDPLRNVLAGLGAPDFLQGLLVDGVFRVLSWVVSVMLPPMAIFFPLFTLLEDSGYLPRIAYNLDKPFRCCSACGKQCLTMCMGFGCNAVGVTGCRIIDSPRERLLSILTNSLVPCNGRFPALIAILTMFFIGTKAGSCSSLAAACLLSALIVLSVLMTFFVTRLLSATVLRGTPSSFVLELPPYRRPQVGRVIVRSVLDRTVFVLGRAVLIAAPAGAVIWLLANVHIGDASLLHRLAAFLDPFGRFLGLDGVILLAFVLGFPANEIVLPIVVMAYLAETRIASLPPLTEMYRLFTENGWTGVTAACTLLFFLFHWPCSTTLLTIKKETGSLRWTALAAIIPTLCGIVLCVCFRLVFVRIVPAILNSF